SAVRPITGPASPRLPAMFFERPITGRSLPPGTLCLTFDDGPGAGTLGLAEDLHHEGIRAAFFAVGVHLAEAPEVPDRLRERGHGVGTHTLNHPHLPDLVRAGGDPAGPLARVDVLIRRADGGTPRFFRPPYGAWIPQVARALNGDFLLALGHVGPIHW